MSLTSITAVFYSATGTTAKIACEIAKRLSESLNLPWKLHDYTLPENREGHTEFSAQDLVVFATPVYAGRIPNKLLPHVQNGFQGNGALAVPVVIFGNRSFDNGLIELRNELESNGFHTVSAAAFPTEHVFSDRIASGRPDQQDWEKIREFARLTAEKISQSSMPPAPVEVPGENPPTKYYTPLGIDGQPTVFLKAKPKTHEALCDACGVCAKVCPMGAISHEDFSEVPGICIKCQACIKKCHSHAKYFDDPAFLSHVAMLEEHYTRRSEPAIFL